MRGFLRVLVAVTIVLTAAVPTATPVGVVLAAASTTPVAHTSAPVNRSPHDPDRDLQRIEQLLYHASLADFLATTARPDGWLDISTDQCSAPVVHSTGRSFDFRGPCRRHDFGYRNLQLLDRRYACPNRPNGQVCATPGTLGRWWNAASRARVDQQFLADMNGTCWSRPWYQRYTCLAWARTFYLAVRAAGGP